MSECTNETCLAEKQRLREDSEKLRRLRAAGVDNWEGYSYAMHDDEEEEPW